MSLQTEFTNTAFRLQVRDSKLFFAAKIGLFSEQSLILTCSSCFPPVCALPAVFHWQISEKTDIFFRFLTTSFNFSQPLRMLRAPDATSLLVFSHSFVPFRQELTEKHHKDFRIPPICAFQKFYRFEESPQTSPNQEEI